MGAAMKAGRNRPHGAGGEERESVTMMQDSHSGFRVSLTLHFVHEAGGEEREIARGHPIPHNCRGFREFRFRSSQSAAWSAPNPKPETLDAARCWSVCGRCASLAIEKNVLVHLRTGPVRAQPGLVRVHT